MWHLNVLLIQSKWLRFNDLLTYLSVKICKISKFMRGRWLEIWNYVQRVIYHDINCNPCVQRLQILHDCISSSGPIKNSILKKYGVGGSSGPNKKNADVYSRFDSWVVPMIYRLTRYIKWHFSTNINWYKTSWRCEEIYIGAES